ncbi:MAG: biotin carboxylase N-terminal domain-containing protein, partial [Planctomycetota bacterium]
MFERILIANRGAIACRVIRTCRRLGIHCIAVYADADVDSLHVSQADTAVSLGDGTLAETYLDGARIIAIAREHGAEAIHPGYGLLSENPDFAEAVEAAGLAFIGPTAEQMRAFGLKHSARALAEANAVPLLPGSGLLPDVDAACRAAVDIGYPVMLKSTAGGGGIGMRLCQDEVGLREAFAVVRRLADNNFGDGGLFIERFVQRARHIEVQIVGDGTGTVVALGERDCSLQRRNQKVVEETPAPDLTPGERATMVEAALRLARAVRYRNAGTVEFVFDAQRRSAAFLEVNTRLQVEHGVTELVTGVDLVEWMLRIAAGDHDVLRGHRHQVDGHAIQARIYAEDPLAEYRPCTGRLTAVAFPDGCRVDTWVQRGTPITPRYDPLLAKVLVHAADRAAALDRLGTALAATHLAGVGTNLDWLVALCGDPDWRAGAVSTAHLQDFRPGQHAVAVLDGGPQTTVQDWPGRVGHWDVGVPPSGPMDDYAHRLANRLLGNAADAATLECTAQGPRLQFRCATAVAICGAPAPVELDGQAVPQWTALPVPAGAH